MARVLKSVKRGAPLLALALAVMTLSCALCDPAPVITSISPMSATAGGKQFLLTVNGHDFASGALVSWNGTFRVTTFLSRHQLVASIPASDIAQPGQALLVAVNPPSGVILVSGGIGTGDGHWCNAATSNGATFTINP